MEEVNYRAVAKDLTKRIKNHRQISLHELDATLDQVIKNIQNDQVLMFFHHYATMDALVKLLEVVTDEAVLDKVSNAIANLCGGLAASEKIVQFSFPEQNLQPQIREPSYAEAGLGWKTWFSGIIMSKLIIDNVINLKNRDVLELGCGTGLTGIIACKTGVKSILMTDYHDRVLENAKLNLNANSVSSTIATVKKLDWNDVYENQSEEHVECSDTIIAADVIYDNNHPALVPKAVSVLLKKTKEAVCYIVIPRRTRFLKDIAAFEESFDQFGLEKVEHKVFTHKDFPENDVNKLDRLDVPHLYYKYQWRNLQ